MVYSIESHNGLWLHLINTIPNKHLVQTNCSNITSI